MPKPIFSPLKKAVDEGGIFKGTFTKFYYVKGVDRSISVVCSKKIFKNAVDRNRVRRVYKASFCDLAAKLPIGNYVAIVKRGIIQIDINEQYKEVRNEWLSLIQSF